MFTYHFSFRERSKSWQVILSYKDSSGRWRQRSRQGLPSKKAAKAAGAELLQRVQKMLSVTPIDPSLIGISLKEFSEYVFQDRHLSYNSLLAYRYALQKFGSFLSRPVQEITYLDIQRAMAHWDCAAATRLLNITCLKLVMSYAVSPYHLRNDNPANDIKLPKTGRRHKVRALTRKEFSHLLQAMEAFPPKYRLACAIAGYTGMRFGEIVALTWYDIDFKQQQIHVTKQYVRISRGKSGIRQLKNGDQGCRILPIPLPLLQILQQYRHTQPLSFSGSLWINGRPCNSNLNRYLRKVIPDISVHSLRHTYATFLLANGEDIKTVSALLGDTVTTVLNVYVDYTDDMRRHAADTINRIFA